MWLALKHDKKGWLSNVKRVALKRENIQDGAKFNGTIYSGLEKAGAFLGFTSEKIFEAQERGMLA